MIQLALSIAIGVFIGLVLYNNPKELFETIKNIIIFCIGSALFLALIVVVCIAIYYAFVYSYKLLIYIKNVRIPFFHNEFFTELGNVFGFIFASLFDLLLIYLTVDVIRKRLTKRREKKAEKLEKSKS